MNQILQDQATQQQSLFNRAKEMADGKNNDELTQIAKNICKSKGIDYEAALQQFQAMWFAK